MRVRPCTGAVARSHDEGAGAWCSAEEGEEGEEEGEEGGEEGEEGEEGEGVGIANQRGGFRRTTTQHKRYILHIHIRISGASGGRLRSISGRARTSSLNQWALHTTLALTC